MLPIYGGFTIINIIVILLFFFVILSGGGPRDNNAAAGFYTFAPLCTISFILLLSLASLWPNFAILVKRYHDLDKSGWWVLILLIPIIGAIFAIIELGFTKGTPDSNKSGAETY